MARDRTHLVEVARDIASVVEAEDAPVLFRGPAGREATALLLVAIAAHESGFQKAIDACEKRGDGGRSRTMWQMIAGVHLQGHSYEAVCSDRRLAARLALDALALARKNYPFSTIQRILNAYTSGDLFLSTPQSRRTCSFWQTRAERFGLVGAYCHKLGSVGFRPKGAPVRWVGAPLSVQARAAKARRPKPPARPAPPRARKSPPPADRDR